MSWMDAIKVVVVFYLAKIAFVIVPVIVLFFIGAVGLVGSAIMRFIHRIWRKP